MPGPGRAVLVDVGRAADQADVGVIGPGTAVGAAGHPHREPLVFAGPSRASSTSSWSRSPGRARSASVTARPQVGRAGQAIDQRRTVEICSTVAIPYSASQLSISPRQAGSRSASRIDCWQVNRAGVWYFSEESPQAAGQPKVALVLDPAILDRDAQEELAVALRVPAQVIVDAGDAAPASGRRADGRGTPRPWRGRPACPSRE